ncbi:hypothetical protein BH11PAT3_BH11PAT3_0710 [soil metagenome]
MKADIFFFVTTIAVVVVSIAVLASLYYVVGAFKRLEAYAVRIEENMKDASAEVKEMGEDIRDSFIYNFIFKKKKRRSARETRD